MIANARKTERLEVWFSGAWLWFTTVVGTLVLVGLFAASFWLTGYVWENGHRAGVIAAWAGGAIAVLSYLFSEPLVALVTKAKRVDENDRLFRLTDQVAKMARMRTPRVYRIPESAPNAFATGVYFPILSILGLRGAVGFTSGIEKSMTDDELRGVIGHELTHLKSFDLPLAAMASGLVITLSILLRVMWRWPQLLGKTNIGSSSSSTSSKGSSKSDGKGAAGCLSGLLYLLLKILLVVIVMIGFFVITQVVMPMVRSWISRQREYWADQGAANILGSPEPLISALRKLENARSTTVEGAGHFSGMFFNMPAFPQRDFIDRLFSTHPETQDRIRVLSRRADGQFNLL